MPFLERLSQRLLGQPLQLPSLDVWWLGEPSAYAFAMAHLDSMIVRPCLGQDREPIVVGMLEGEARQALQQRIEANPGHFVAQYPVAPSLNPKWDGEALVPSAVVLRCFVVADGDSWRVLPGGLAREPAGDTALQPARPAQRHAQGRLGAGRGRGRRADPDQPALPPARGRSRQRRPAEPRRRQPLLARPLRRAARQRRAPAAPHRHPRGAGRDRRARGRRAPPARQADRPRQPDAEPGGAGDARERRLPAAASPPSPSEQARPRHGARRHPAPDRHAARPLLARHDDRRRPAAERGAQRPARRRAATSIRCSPRSTTSSASSRRCRASPART